MNRLLAKPFLVLVSTALLVAHSSAAEPKPQVADLKPEIVRFDPFTWPSEIPEDCPFEPQKCTIKNRTGRKIIDFIG